MQITKLVFSGTPEEYESVAHLFSDSQAVNMAITLESESTTEYTVSAEQIQRVLKRKTIPPGQQDIFKVLFASEKNGLTKSQLAQKTHREAKEIDGVLGALGRRINNSSSVLKNSKPGIGLLLHYERTADSEWLYRLRPEFRKVLSDLNPVWLHTKPKGGRTYRQKKEE